MHDSTNPPKDPSSDPTVWIDVERLLDGIAELARNETAEEVFYSQLLSAAVGAVEGAGGILWLRTIDGAIEPKYQTGVEQAGFTASPPIEQSHLGLVQSVIAAKQPDWLMPSSGVAGQARWNPTACTLAFQPIHQDGQLFALLEVALQGAAADWEQGVLQVLSAMALMAEDFARHRELRHLRSVAARNDGVADFAQAVHQRLDSRRTAFAIANHAPLITACDRVMVFTAQGKRLRLTAVTGVASIDRRTPLNRAAKSLAEAVAALREPLVYLGDHDDLPPALDRRVTALVDLSHARTLAVQPLMNEQTEELTGVLLAENIRGESLEALGPQMQALAPTAAAALSNALEYESLPLLGFSRSKRRLQRKIGVRSLSWTAAILAAITVLALFLILVPIDFTVEATGELQPVEVVDLFAPRDATVLNSPMEHNADVVVDQVVLTLHSDDLDLAIEEAVGALNSTRQKLTDISKERLKPRRETEPSRISELAAEENRLRQEAVDQTDRLKDLQQQQDQLQLRSPIAGRVLSWDTEKLLRARPVRRGQSLLSVADVEGDWKLTLRVPDNRIGPILAARETAGDKLRVTFIVQSDATLQLEGTVAEISRVTETDEAGEPYVPVTVKLTNTTGLKPRPGAQALGKIHCGRQACGYVWFYDFFNAVRTYILF